MGRSSTSDRGHRHDDEKAAKKRRIEDDSMDQRHNGANLDIDDSHSNNSNEKDGSRRRYKIENEKRSDWKHVDKKHRRDRSTKRDSSDRIDSNKRKSKKDRHRTHDSIRIDDNDSDHDEKNASKRRKRHCDEDDKRKKVKKGKSHDGGEREAARTARIIVDKSTLYSLGEQRGSPPSTLLDPENDYFAQNQRFRLYLYRECGLTFDDLTSKDARMKFHDFVRQYNFGRLEVGYYSPTLPIEALEECPSTRYQWGLRITQQDSQSLRMLHAGVQKQTEYQATDINHQPTIKPSASHIVHPSNKETTGNEQNSVQHIRVMNRRLREHVQTTVEELTGGRKEGRERQIEKRQERAAKIHGASKYEQDMVELDDSTLYGGSTDDEFRRLSAASKQRTAQQESKKEERMVALQQKEQERQNAMLQMLGLSHKIGQSKIEIQPRNDPPDNK